MAEFNRAILLLLNHVTLTRQLKNASVKIVLRHPWSFIFESFLYENVKKTTATLRWKTLWKLKCFWWQLHNKPSVTWHKTMKWGMRSIKVAWCPSWSDIDLAAPSLIPAGRSILLRHKGVATRYRSNIFKPGPDGSFLHRKK